MGDYSLTPRIVLANGGLQLGGSTTFLINFGAELVRRHVPVLVTSFEWENPLADDFRKRSIPLHVEDQRAHIFEDRMQSTLRAIKKFEPNCVVSCLGPDSFEIQRYVPKGVLRLGMVQSDYPEIYPDVAVYRPYLDGVVGVSRSIERNLAAHPSLGQVPSYYLPYGIQPPPENRRPFRPPEMPLRILYLGRLCRAQKRVHLFPELLRRLIAAEISFVWTIAGDGVERGVLERELCSARPHQQVRFVGPVGYEAVPALLAESDIFLLISDAEGLPLSLLEAMAYGVVPVVSDLPSGVPEVVSRDTGRRVPIDCLQGYVEAIAELHLGRDELQRLGSNAANIVSSEFSAARMADRWLAILPRNLQSPVSWPKRFNVASPLAARHRVLFSQPLRLVRRWVRASRRLWARDNRPAKR